VRYCLIGHECTSLLSGLAFLAFYHSSFPLKKYSKQPFQNQQDMLHKLVQVKLGLTTANAFSSEAGL